MRPILSHLSPATDTHPRRSSPNRRRSARTGPPMTPSRADPTAPDRRPPTDARVHHGDVFVDPYEWLRDKDDDDGDRLPGGRERLHRRRRTAHLIRALRGDLRRDQGPHPGDRPERARRTARTPTAAGLLVLRPHRRGLGVPDLLPHPGHRRTAARPAGRSDGGRSTGEQILLDAQHARPTGHDFFSIGAFAVSPDGRLLAYSTDTTGAERFTLRVVDLATGEQLADDDRRHRVRRRVGRRDASLLHPRRRRPGGRTWCCGTGWAPTRPTTRRC